MQHPWANVKFHQDRKKSHKKNIIPPPPTFPPLLTTDHHNLISRQRSAGLQPAARDDGTLAGRPGPGGRPGRLLQHRAVRRGRHLLGLRLGEAGGRLPDAPREGTAAGLRQRRIQDHREQVPLHVDVQGRLRAMGDSVDMRR